LLLCRFRYWLPGCPPAVACVQATICDIQFFAANAMWLLRQKNQPNTYYGRFRFGSLNALARFPAFKRPILTFRSTPPGSIWLAHINQSDQKRSN